MCILEHSKKIPLAKYNFFREIRENDRKKMLFRFSSFKQEINKVLQYFK